MRQCVIAVITTACLVCASLAATFPFSFWSSRTASGPPTESLFAWYIGDDQLYANGDDMTNGIVDSFGGDSHKIVLASASYFKMLTNAKNGHSAIDKRGSGSSLYNTNFTALVQGFTIVAALRTNPVNEAAPTFHILARGDGKAGIQYNRLGANVIYTGHGNDGTVTITNTVDTWQVVSVTYDRTEGITRIKNNANSNSSGVSANPTFSLTTLVLQASRTNTVAEWLVYSNKLSDVNLATVRSYLATKYDIAITP